MAEKESRRSPFQERIPEDARAHFRTAREELRESIAGLLPPEFVEHRRNARREMLLAWRSIIDSALKRMEEKD